MSSKKYQWNAIIVVQQSSYHISSDDYIQPCVLSGIKLQASCMPCFYAAQPSFILCKQDPSHSVDTTGPACLTNKMKNKWKLSMVHHRSRIAIFITLSKMDCAASESLLNLALYSVFTLFWLIFPEIFRTAKSDIGRAIVSFGNEHERFIRSWRLMRRIAILSRAEFGSTVRANTSTPIRHCAVGIYRFLFRFTNSL